MIEKRTAVIKVYCTEEEKATWAEVAYICPLPPDGYTLSSWLRQLALRHIAEMDRERDERKAAG